MIKLALLALAVVALATLPAHIIGWAAGKLYDWSRRPHAPPRHPDPPKPSAPP